MSPNAVQDTMADRPVLEPVAICGMSCRLPGGVDSASTFWKMLVDKRTGQTARVPRSRFNIDAHYHRDLDRPGSFNIPGGYFLDGLPSDFDHSFFNITPIEAQWLDPQQRRMLEVSYECLESAGLTLDQVAGSNTGVYVGCFTADYQQMAVKEPDFRHNYAATGVDPGIISDRIGNIFNLNGPSFTINAACTSSIYALHTACNALRSGDCEAAIVGGVNLILTVDQHMNTAKLGILSPTSTCHTFDESADGYGRAEGAGALYVRRLSDAIRDGNPIRGVIRGTAINTNGKVEGMGITHPSGQSQESVVRMAYAKAGLETRFTPYAELHGTGTPVGDPIEVKAISQALNDERSTEEPLLIGALKPNIGHSEAASGIFAVMKAALMTEAAIIPGVALFNRLNPNIKDKEWNVRIHADTAAWPEKSSLKRASVSSFGYGGSNGHVIIEAADNLLPYYRHGGRKKNSNSDKSTTRPHLVCFSAHDKSTLLRNITAIKSVAAEYYVTDLAYTLNLHRTKFAHRAFAILREGQEDAGLAPAELKSGVAPKSGGEIGFVFTGQGAQWVGMGKVAIEEFPLFQETIEKLDRVILKMRPRPTFTLRGMLTQNESASRFNEPEVAQPLCTAVQIALVDLFSEWNIVPSVSVGHSSGEIAAAYAAGLISAAEAIVIAFVRGRAVQQASSVGSMLAVGLGVKDVEKWLPSDPEKTCIACENSPCSVTLSGQAEAISEMATSFKKEGIFAQELATGRAYHSPHMAVVGDAYDAMLPVQLAELTEDDLNWRYSRSSMVSSVTGKPVVGESLATSYWSMNLRERVLFDSAVRQIGSDKDFEKITSFMEIGCHSALSRAFKQINLTKKAYIPTLLRDKNDIDQLLAAAGLVFLEGHRVDLEVVNLDLAKDSNHAWKSSVGKLLVDLPPYQWNYEKSYYAEARASTESRNRLYPRHDLLGTRVPGLSDSCKVWRNILRHRDVPWLKDHSLGDDRVFPAAGYLSAAIEGLRQIHEIGDRPFSQVVARNVDIRKALVIPEGDGIEIMTCLHTTNGIEHRFTTESITSGVWTLHCEGTISANNCSMMARDHPVDEMALTQRVPGRRWYDAFHRVGFNYENTFQALLEAKSDKSLHHAAGDVVTTQSSSLMIDESRYLLHPRSIDACLQLIIISCHSGKYKTMPHGVVPTHIEKFTLVMSEDQLDDIGHAVAWADKVDDRRFNTNTCLVDSRGELIMDIESLECTAYEAVVPPATGPLADPEPFSKMIWQPNLGLLPISVRDQKTLNDIIELICHKQSVRDVLICGSPSSTTVRPILDRLPSTCNVTLGVSGEQETDIASFEDFEGRVSLKTLHTSSDAWATDLNGSQSDLIIVDFCVLDNSDASRPVVASLQPLLKNDGWIIGLSRYFSSLPSSALIFGQLVAFKKPQAEQSTIGGDSIPCITVLSPESSIAETDSLTPLLTERGVIAQERELASFVGAKDECFIVDDRRGSTLLSPTEENYKKLKEIMLSENPILWLTRGVQEGKCMEGGMAQGFVRTIQSEQASSRISLLDIDCNTAAEDLTTTVLSVLGLLSRRSPGADNEFWLHHGILHIPRLYCHAQPRPSLAVQTDTAGYAEHCVETNVGLKDPQTSLSSDGTYVLVGCLGGIGRSLTTWMLQHGAKHFAFISRSGADRSEAARVIENIEKSSGTSTRVYRANVSDELAVRSIVFSLQAERPVRGVVHAAMVLKDGMFEQMTYNSFMAAITPKVRGAINLHNAFGEAKLDFFVMTSSVSALLGNMGQANYSAANSFLDALALYRTRLGLAATSLALPMVLDVGVVAENDAIEASLTRKGLYGINEEEMLRGFEAAMLGPRGTQKREAASVPSNLVMGMEARELSRAITSISAESRDLFWADKARFCHVVAAVEAVSAQSNLSPGSHGGVKEQGFAAALEAARLESPEAVVTVITQHVARRMSGVLMIPEDEFELDGPSLASYGLDSMVGAEMRTWLFKEFGIDYSFQKLLSSSLTFRALARVIAEHTGVIEKSEDQ
ncbi:ketoacyl-synt-domain-containing protein [Xylariaceae sp. FL1019]|nr:ketoacyl-synt-domain-containing protein [Xylariaceae sp. FL1019]